MAAGPSFVIAEPSFVVAGPSFEGSEPSSVITGPSSVVAGVSFKAKLHTWVVMLPLMVADLCLLVLTF